MVAHPATMPVPAQPADSAAVAVHLAVVAADAGNFAATSNRQWLAQLAPAILLFAGSSVVRHIKQAQPGNPTSLQQPLL